VLGIHRVTELARIREEEDAAKRAAKASAAAPTLNGASSVPAAAAGGTTIRRFNLEHLTGLLDRWSFHNVVTLGK
jgi:hypothetical protein